MPRGAVFVFVPTLIAVSCHKNIARPPVEEVPIRDPSENVAPATSITVIKSSGKEAKPMRVDSDPSVPVTPASASAPQADPDPPRDKAFPKTVDACKKDQDCAVTNLALGGEFMCCSPCKPVAGTKGWVRKVEQVCAQKAKNGWKPTCAPFDCSKADVECKGGKCVVRL
jgi:hypothetical protein